MSNKHINKAVEIKYNRVRPHIRNGDIICVRGTSWLPRIIEWADSSYYSHALVVVQNRDRLECIQAMGGGVQPYFLSTEIFNNVDFCILRPKFSQHQIDHAVNKFFAKGTKGIPYDYAELPRIMLKKKFGVPIKDVQGNKHEAICSVAAGYIYGGFFPIECYQEAYKKQGYLSPQDLIRFADPTEIHIIENNPIIKKLL